MARRENDRSSRLPAGLLGELSASQANRAADTETGFGRAEQLRVFISSEMASGALAAERAAAADEVNKHPDFVAWKWEGSVSAGRYPSLEECIGNAQTSDLLILILGDGLTDATKAEWRAARGNGANCNAVPGRVAEWSGFSSGKRQSNYMIMND